jgi:hypothetical protein
MLCAAAHSSQSDHIIVTGEIFLILATEMATIGIILVTRYYIALARSVETAAAANRIFLIPFHKDGKTLHLFP